MSATDIQWTDRVWNPVRGCSRVSAGCDNCYAMRQAHRFSGAGKPYDGLTVLRRGKVDWRGHARLAPEMLAQPLRWRKPSRIFVNSMSDLFHPSLTDEEIAAVFGVMAASPEHTFQVLTKRPERMIEWFKWVAAAEDDPYTTCLREAASHVHPTIWERVLRDTGLEQDFPEFEPWPLRNVWLGVSVEDQKTVDERIPLLKKVPAAFRFISAEPLLDRIQLRTFDLRGGTSMHMVMDIEGALRNRTALKAFTDDEGRRMHPKAAAAELRALLAKGHKLFPMCACEDFDPFENGCKKDVPGLDWVIVGGESGHGARDCEVSWIRNVVRQCSDAKVPCFVKQLGSRARDQDHFGAATERLTDKAGGDPNEWPEDLRVRQFPGGAA